MLFECGSKAKENQILENTAFFEWKLKENRELIHVASKEDEFEAFLYNIRIRTAVIQFVAMSISYFYHGDDADCK